MSGLFGAGAALIATGNVMQKVGTVVEMAGNYGQAAANITKTAAYAAEGNLAGAMASAASAVQTGTAAVKSSKNLGKTFDNINQQAEQATQKLASNAAAKDAVNGMTEEQLGGMTKKEMKNSISGQLQAQMADGNLEADSLLQDLKNGNLSETNFNAVNSAADSARNSFSSAVEGAGGTIEKGVVGGLDNKARKKAGQKTVSKFQNIASKTVKSSQKFDWGKIAQGLQSTAALFMSQNTPQMADTTPNYVPQWDLSKDSRFQKIRRARIASYGHAAYV